MKYKYSRFMILLQWSLVFVYAALWPCFFYLIGKDIAWIQKNSIVVTVFILVFISIYNGEYMNRYVEISDDYIRFNSFRFKRMKKVLSLNVRFDNFYSIEARTLPLFGLWGIRINAKDIPHPITVSFCFSKHKKLYRTLCAQVKQHNPKVYIDEKLEKYIGDGENE